MNDSNHNTEQENNKLYKMKQLIQIKTALAAVLLSVLAVPSASAYTAQQLIGSGRVGVELAYAGYQQATMHSFGNGVGVTIEQSEVGDDWVVIRNMFDGLADVHFCVYTQNGTTYLEMGSNDEYSYRFSQTCTSKDSRYKEVRIIPANKTNSEYATNVLFLGKVTYDAQKNSFQVDFSQPVRVECFTGSNHTGLAYNRFHNLYTVMFFQPTATITDKKVSGSGTVENRSYGAQFRINKSENASTGITTFEVTNWGGTGLGIKGTQTSTPPGISNQWYRMTGYYDAKNMKMYMDGGEMYMQDNSEVYAGTSSYYGNPYTYRMWAVNNAYNPTAKYNRDIAADVTFDHVTAQHTGSDLWASPHGGLKTTADLHADFEDWGVYNQTRNDYGKKFGFRATDTHAVIPDWDITLQLQQADFTLQHFGQAQAADPSKMWVQADAAFQVVKNDMFVDSYDVYAVEGSSPKDGKAIWLGNVKKSEKDSKGIYTASGSFSLQTPDGKPWADHFGKMYNYTYSLYVKANYAFPSAASAADGTRMAVASLEPSHHGLGSTVLSVTVGVDGIGADDNIRMEATQNGIMVSAPSDMDVQVVNMAGMTVASGKANTEISIDAKGVFIVKAGTKVFKIAR